MTDVITCLFPAVCILVAVVIAKCKQGKMKRRKKHSVFASTHTCPNYDASGTCVLLNVDIHDRLTSFYIFPDDVTSFLFLAREWQGRKLGTRDVDLLFQADEKVLKLFRNHKKVEFL